MTMERQDFETYLGDAREYSNPHEQYLKEVLRADPHEKYHVKLRHYRLAFDDHMRHTITIACHACAKAYVREAERLTRSELRSGLWTAHESGCWHEVPHGVYMEMKAQHAEFYDCLCSACHERIKERQASDPRYTALIQEIQRFYQALEVVVQETVPHHYQAFVDLFSAEDASGMNPAAYADLSSEADWHHFFEKYESKWISQVDGYVRSKTRHDYAELNEKIRSIKKMMKQLDRPYYGVYELVEAPAQVNHLKIKETNYLPFRYFHDLSRLSEVAFTSRVRLRKSALKRLKHRGLTMALKDKT